MSEIGLFEAIYSTSGVVGIRPDPVEEEKIERVLDAAIRAPSGSNTQPWEFVVVGYLGARTHTHKTTDLRRFKLRCSHH
jgi:nitroreductase